MEEKRNMTKDQLEKALNIIDELRFADTFYKKGGSL